jgi:flagellar export protein FliJ
VAVSRVMLRLLRIRELEEEQNRAALESALGELNRLEHALESTLEWERTGRRMVAESTVTGVIADRLLGLLESRAAAQRSVQLAEQIAEATEEISIRRDALLRKRVERRQAETLVDEARAQQAVETLRREQHSLDDWFRNRRPGKLDAQQDSSESTADSQ